jgi:hypothetical protein
MKKVIIITREGYNTSCEAYKKIYSDNTTSLCIENPKIHQYIRDFLEKLLNNIDERRWDKSFGKKAFPCYNDIWGPDFENTRIDGTTYKNYKEGTEKPELPKEWRKKRIFSQLDKLLKTKPYVNFVHECRDVHTGNIQEYDVYFVFLNRIFDTFVNGSEEYKNLINDEKRLDFITAICQDCGLVADGGMLAKDQEKAMLYIHDKEWYVEGSPYTAMQKEKYTFMAASTKEQQQKLEEYFDTIKVFLHVPSTFFNEITSLSFTDYDLDLDIRGREYF